MKFLFYTFLVKNVVVFQSFVFPMIPFKILVTVVSHKTD